MYVYINYYTNCFRELFGYDYLLLIGLSCNLYYDIKYILLKRAKHQN